MLSIFLSERHSGTRGLFPHAADVTVHAHPLSRGAGKRGFVRCFVGAPPYLRRRPVFLHSAPLRALCGTTIPAGTRLPASFILRHKKENADSAAAKASPIYAMHI